MRSSPCFAPHRSGPQSVSDTLVEVCARSVCHLGPWRSNRQTKAPGRETVLPNHTTNHDAVPSETIRFLLPTN